MRYKRHFVDNAWYFFTLTLHDRRQTLLVDQIDLLRESFQLVKRRHPFSMPAIVVLPDHLHAIWRLPMGDTDYPLRWRLIKSNFSRQLPHLSNEKTNSSRIAKGERGVWQRRYWESTLLDERDVLSHIEYIHNNPVKHGYVSDPSEWPYSSIHIQPRF